MSKRYFGFGMADGMFGGEVLASRRPLTAEGAREFIETVQAENICLNPSHQATISAMNQRFDIHCEIPPRAANIKLKPGDQLLVMSPTGLPRLEGRHEYTQEEIDKAEFRFGLWTVLE